MNLNELSAALNKAANAGINRVKIRAVAGDGSVLDDGEFNVRALLSEARVRGRLIKLYAGCSVTVSAAAQAETRMARRSELVAETCSALWFKSMIESYDEMIPRPYLTIESTYPDGLVAVGSFDPRELLHFAYGAAMRREVLNGVVRIVIKEAR